MMPSFLRKYIALCHSKKGTGCQTVETSHTGRYRVPNSREISHRTLQVTRAKYQYSVFMFSWRGSRGSISFSRSDFSSLFDARCDDCNQAHIGEAGVNPVESPNVETNFVDCVLDKLVMKSRYKSSLPKSSILIVHCTSWWTKSVKWCKVPMPEEGREAIVVQLNNNSDL